MIAIASREGKQRVEAAFNSMQGHAFGWERGPDRLTMGCPKITSQHTTKTFEKMARVGLFDRDDIALFAFRLKAIHN